MGIAPPIIVERGPGGRAGYLADPEVSLMMAVRCGDDAAFGRLMDRYRRRLMGYFLRRLGDHQEAEDLTQEVFLRLYRCRHRYQPKARFATWLFRISSNVLRNALRTRVRRPMVCIGTLTALAVEQEAGPRAERRQPGPSAPLEQDEVAGAVRAAVSALGGRQRMALELHQFKSHTYAEVAAELATTPDAAKSLLHRARRQLRSSLEPLSLCL